MGLLEFSKLPINTLVGADAKTFDRITAGRIIDASYEGKYRLTKAVGRLLSVLKPLQDRRYEKLLANKPLEHDPVFILGHWRSAVFFSVITVTSFTCEGKTVSTPSFPEVSSFFSPQPANIPAASSSTYT